MDRGCVSVACLQLNTEPWGCLENVRSIPYILVPRHSGLLCSSLWDRTAAESKGITSGKKEADLSWIHPESTSFTKTYSTVFSVWSNQVCRYSQISTGFMGMGVEITVSNRQVYF